jgi:hypothetical protein
VGLKAASSNPYEAGPSLVGAKLTWFSPVGDFPVPALANAFPNDAYAAFGDDARFRLRLFTSGGFSPDGVSPILPTDFDRLFRLHATDVRGRPVVISRAGVRYDLGVGSVEVLGLAEVGAPQPQPIERAYYVEDHDNYFDVVLKGDLRAVRRLVSVEIPTSAEPGYFDIYNPGGPGRTPQPDTVYTRPALPQFQPIFVSLDDLRTVSYAEQSLAHYDDDGDLAVVFRLRDPRGPERFTASSILAREWVDEGSTVVGVEFANEMARPGVLDVEGFVNVSTGDRIYTLDHVEQARLSAPSSGWLSEGRVFGAFARPERGASPIYRFYNQKQQRHYFSADRRPMETRPGYRFVGVAWYSARFQE